MISVGSFCATLEPSRCVLGTAGVLALIVERRTICYVPVLLWTVTRTPVLSFVKDGRGWIHSSLFFVVACGRKTRYSVAHEAPYTYTVR